MSELHRLDQTLLERAAKEWALEAHGWCGRKGGWIYAGNTPIIQGWYEVARRYRGQILDWLTAKLTGCRTLAEILDAPGYRPTILVRGSRDWRYHLLADAYDLAQRQRGDKRRAHRGVAAKAGVS